MFPMNTGVSLYITEILNLGKLLFGDLVARFPFSVTLSFWHYSSDGCGKCLVQFEELYVVTLLRFAVVVSVFKLAGSRCP